MVTIDLTPLNIRREQLGRARCARLSLVAAGLLSVALMSSGWSAWIMSRQGVHRTQLITTQTEISRLEREIKKRSDVAIALDEAHKQSGEARRRRRFVADILALLATLTPQYLSLSKVHATLHGALISGYARDAQVVSQYVDALTSRCPELHSFVDGAQKAMVGSGSVESFSVRLSLSESSHAASWCNVGVLQEEKGEKS